MYVKLCFNISVTFRNAIISNDIIKKQREKLTDVDKGWLAAGD